MKKSHVGMGNLQWMETGLRTVSSGRALMGRSEVTAVVVVVSLSHLLSEQTIW